MLILSWGKSKGRNQNSFLRFGLVQNYCGKERTTWTAVAKNWIKFFFQDISLGVLLLKA